VFRCYLSGLQESGVVTLKVMSRAGRITMAGHIMTIVRNILGEDAAGGVGRIRMLQENGDEVCIFSKLLSICYASLCMFQCCSTALISSFAPDNDRACILHVSVSIVAGVLCGGMIRMYKSACCWWTSKPCGVKNISLGFACIV